MPIPKERRKLYPDNWLTEIRPRILVRAKNRCEKCSVPNRQKVLRSGRYWSLEELLPFWVDDFGHKADGNALEDLDIENVRTTEIVLTIHHIDADPTNNDDSNLVALCQRDHLEQDRLLHSRNAAETRRQKRLAREPELPLNPEEKSDGEEEPRRSGDGDRAPDGQGSGGQRDPVHEGEGAGAVPSET